MFNQLFTHPREHWKTATFWRSWTSDQEMVFLVALSLGFGFSAPSNVAQRFSGGLRALVDREPRDGRPRKGASPLRTNGPGSTTAQPSWRASPRATAGAPSGKSALSSYCSGTATSSPTSPPGWPLACRERPGSYPQLVAATSASGSELRMTQAFKRHVGLGALWVGLNQITAFGVVAIPTPKRLRAIHALSRALERQLPLEEASSLIGLLVHLLPWAALDESTTSGLFVFGELGPKDVVTLIHKPRLSAWRQRLASTSGVCASTVITPSEARPDQDPSVFLFTDAALDGTTAPGLGGFLHGYWFHVPIPASLGRGSLNCP